MDPARDLGQEGQAKWAERVGRPTPAMRLTAPCVPPWQRKIGTCGGKHFASVTKGKVSKFEQILDDMKTQRTADSNFKAVIVTETTEEIGEWMKQFSKMSVVVAQTSKGKIKTKTQRAIEEFQSGKFDIFVCPVAPVSASWRVRTHPKSADASRRRCCR